MWLRSVALAVVLALLPTPARAQESAPRTERGFLTGLGISLLVVGLGGAGLGVSGLVTTVEGAGLISALGMPLQEPDVPAAIAIQKRVADARPVMVAGFITAGVGLVGAILCLVLDAPKAPVQVAVVPTLQGGAVSVSLQF